MNKKVIYTCLVGSYDVIRQPEVVDDSYDYICFSNDIKEERVGVWQIRPIPFEHKDKARLSRYVKLLPHRALKDYEWSLWMDANIQITGKELYSILEDKMSEGGKIYQVTHCLPPCDCTYEEIKLAYLGGRSGLYKTFLQYWHLKREGFPAHWGLFENNFILRKHSDPLVKKISEEWWAEFMKYTKRDQFNLMYVYWKNYFMPGLLLLPDRNTRNVDFLKWHFHHVQPENTFMYRQQYRIRKCLSYSFKALD
ncbi:MAG: DUF616 domain-containing protein [Bacteroidaceae bacterium]|nr:DUF616 domain-containing protein [Bacteroidaceae bacterium]